MADATSGEGSGDGEFAGWRSYWAYSNAVRNAWRYIWPTDVQQFLEAVRRTAKKREFLIPKNQPFFRAQVGWEHDVEEMEDGTLYGPMAFGPQRMKPVASYITDGRANAAGIPVLYLAMEVDTAIAEVRPWVGSAVSVSQFRTTRELRALDLTQEFGNHWMPPFSVKDGTFQSVDADGAEKSVWANIDNAFSRPVNRADDPAEYVPTQILAELFRDEGYEAIVYCSRVRKTGYNVVIFEPDDADPVDGRPYEVAKIKLKAKEAGVAWVSTQ